MFIGIPKTNPNWQKLMTIENAFSVPECDAIIQMFDKANPTEATVNVTGEVIEDVRKARITWLKHEPNKDWLFQKLWNLTEGANEKFWKFQLSGLFEALQLTEYKVGAFYNWHEDSMSPGHSTRKLSFVVQLTEPTEYDGGELVIFPDKIASTKRGSITFFPSFLTHKVQHVLRGQRHSLVAWVTGHPLI